MGKEILLPRAIRGSRLHVYIYQYVLRTVAPGRCVGISLAPLAPCLPTTNQAHERVPKRRGYVKRESAVHDFMYSLANVDVNFSLIGRRVCVINRSDVTRDGVAFCTSTRNQIEQYLERSRACSVCPKKRGTGDEHVHACMAKMSETCDVSIWLTISTKRIENVLKDDKKRSYLFDRVRVSKGPRRTRWNRC